MRIIVEAIAACLLWTALAHAATLRVPDDHATIQAAIDAAAPGDIIELAPGTYGESLTLTTSDLTLRGEDPEICTISPGYRDGVTLTIDQAMGVSLEGITFRQRDVDNLPWNRKEWPDGLVVTGGEVSVQRCRFGPTAGCGVVAEKGAKVTMADCEAHGNPQSGVIALDAETRVTATRCACDRNEFGFSARKRAGLSLNACSAAENKKDGVMVQHTDTDLEVQGGAFARNGEDGIDVEFLSKGDISGTRCEENRHYGIRVKTGATATIGETVCAENGLSGIAAYNLTTEVTVRGGTCQKNKADGISVYGGAKAVIAEGVFDGNSSVGISCSLIDTEAELEGNQCLGNGTHGILVHSASHATLRNNTCSDNQWGIGVRGEGTEAELIENIVLNNTAEGVLREAGEPWLEQRQVREDLLGWLLYLENFERLEQFATDFRGDKGHNSSGESHLLWLYDRIQYGYGRKHYRNRENWREIMGRWREAYPESVTPRILLARGAYRWAWDARGHGYANTVTDAGWDAYHKNIAEERAILDEAESLNAGDPELYRMLVSVARDEHWSTERLREMCAKGLALDPRYNEILLGGVNYFLPRYFGEPGDMARFAVWACEVTRETRGFAPYAYIASHAIRCDDVETFMDFHCFDWDKLAQGFPQLLEESPDSALFLNAYCMAACLYGERELALELFERLGGDNQHAVWEEGEFHRWKAWAHGLGKRPDVGGTIPVLDMTSEEVNRYAYIFLIIGVAFVLMNGLLILLFLVYRGRKRRRLRQPADPD